MEAISKLDVLPESVNHKGFRWREKEGQIHEIQTLEDIGNYNSDQFRGCGRGFSRESVKGLGCGCRE